MSILISVLVFFGVLVGWYLALWKPVNAQVDQTKSSIAIEQQSLQQANIQLSALREQYRSLPALKREAARLETALPKGADLTGFYDALDSAASASGLPLVNISPASPAAAVTGAAALPPTAIPSVTFSIQTEGGYFQIETLLSKLDSLPRLVSVDSVSLSTSGTTVPGYPASDGVILTATIKGQAYERIGS